MTHTTTARSAPAGQGTNGCHCKAPLQRCHFGERTPCTGLLSWHRSPSQTIEGRGKIIRRKQHQKNMQNLEKNFTLPLRSMVGLHNGTELERGKQCKRGTGQSYRASFQVRLPRACKVPGGDASKHQHLSVLPSFCGGAGSSSCRREPWAV